MINSVLINQANNDRFYTLRRNDSLDRALSRFGYNPDDINKINTPLIGASKYMTAKILLAEVGNVSPIPYLGLYAPTPNFKTLWSLVLYEEQGGTGGGGSGGSIGDENDGGVIVVSGSGGVGQGQSEQPRPNRGTGGATNNFTDSSDPNLSLVAKGGGGTVGTYLQGIPDLNRSIKWTNLTCLNMTELILSAGNSETLFQYAPTQAKNTIWLLELVDARYFLRSHLMTDIKNGSTNLKGTSRNQWNMLADNPLHIIPSTCKETQVAEPDFSTPNFRDDDSMRWGMSKNDFFGMPNASRWFNQTLWSTREIIDNVLNGFNAKAAALDKQEIFFNTTAVPMTTHPFDVVNLDLTSRSVGDALDEIAGRSGMCWKWDRLNSVLKLVNASFDGNDAQMQFQWERFEVNFRTAGGISMRNEISPQYFTFIHPLRFASTYGMDDARRIIQDWRRFPKKDGVLDFAPTEALYYHTLQSRTSFNHNSTAFIGDHLPAFIGSVESQTQDWDKHIPSRDSSVTAALPRPWNYDRSKEQDAVWFTHSFATSLEERAILLKNRYLKLNSIVTGNMVTARIPALSSLFLSIGFQNEEIVFGTDAMQLIRYRIWGEKLCPIYAPYLLSTERVSALGLTRATNVAGTLNIQTILPRAGIARTFIGQITSKKSLFPNGHDTMWMYEFREVQILKTKFPTFVESDETNDLQGGEKGFCLNLAEVGLNTIASPNSPPTEGYGGDILNYDDPDEAYVKTIPIGGLGGTYAYVLIYEVINESGARTFWFCVSNGLDVECKEDPAIPINGSWKRDLISGIAFPSTTPLADFIR